MNLCSFNYSNQSPIGQTQPCHEVHVTTWLGWFIQLEAQLPVVWFQKENIARNQLTELFQLRVVPI